MSYLFLRRIAPVFALTLFFSSCGMQGKNTDKNPSTKTQIEQAENSLQSNPAPVQPNENMKESQPTDVWDVSDIDVSKINADKKYIAFTFDDAPSRTMERIFAVYADFNDKNPDCPASATVFFNGNLIDSQSEHLLYVACALGFELGNHTYSHADLTKLTKERVLTEIERTDKTLEKADGKPYHLLRTPFGATNDDVIRCSKTPLIDWTIDTLDWTGVSANAIVESVFSKRFPGAIVLMHDGYENTVEALKTLLPALKADGYQIVNVSQLSKLHNCPLKRGKVYIRARKKAGAGTN